MILLIIWWGRGGGRTLGQQGVNKDLNKDLLIKGGGFGRPRRKKINYLRKYCTCYTNAMGVILYPSINLVLMSISGGGGGGGEGEEPSVGKELTKI